MANTNAIINGEIGKRNRFGDELKEETKENKPEHATPKLLPFNAMVIFPSRSISHLCVSRKVHRAINLQKKRKHVKSPTDTLALQAWPFPVKRMADCIKIKE